MKKTLVNGKPYAIRALREQDVAPGAIVRHAEHNIVFRLLCQDGDEIVARNVRHPALIDAIPRDRILADYVLATPIE